MSARTCWIVAALATLAASASLAGARSVRKVNLTEAINRTVCPIDVKVDENADRVPRRIKMMNCAKVSEDWCRSQQLPAHECCQRRHGSPLLECVEIHDTVLVYYKSRAATEPYVVSVGCTCMLERPGAAFELPHGPA